MISSPLFHSINVRIAAVIFIVCFICITASTLLIANNDLENSKQSLMNEAASIAEIISNNIGAAVAFRDLEHANEIVSALSKQVAINKACIYDTHGALFTSYTTTSNCSTLLDSIAKQDNMILKDIANNGAHFGTACVYYDEQRLYTIRQDLIWKIGINLLFLSLLLVVPITLVINRLIKKPVVELMDTTQLISSPERFDKNNLIVAKENIERMQQQFIQATTLLKFSQEHSQKLIKNFNVTLDIIGHEIAKNHTISETNKKYSEAFELDAVSSQELLKIANNEMSKFSTHFGTLKEMNDTIKSYLSESPEKIDLHHFIEKQFHEYVSSHTLEKFVYRPSSTQDTATMTAYKSALTSFLNYTLKLFDYLCDYPNQGDIHFDLIETKHTKQQLGQLTLTTTSPISLHIDNPINNGEEEETEPYDTQDNPLTNKASGDDQFAYLLEAITLFANLNCTNVDKPVNVSLLNNGVEISFIITDSRVTDAQD